LGEVGLLQSLALRRELQVKRNARPQERAVVLADEVAVPLRVAVVENRHHVNVEARATEGDRDAVGLRLHLVWAEIRKRLSQAVGEILQEGGDILGRVSATDVAGDVDIIQRPQGRTFRKAP
jgi:hypothetical protein